MTVQSLTKPRGPVVRAVPDGDDRERWLCQDCGFVNYENPRICVAAVVVADDGRFLLCKRAIEPALGRWTIPGGYMELGETPQKGAAREAWEEAGATVEIGPLQGMYTILSIGQVLMVFRATLLNADSIAAGTESLDVGLFHRHEIPWDNLAFDTVQWSLDAYDATQRSTLFTPDYRVI